MNSFYISAFTGSKIFEIPHLKDGIDALHIVHTDISVLDGATLPKTICKIMVGHSSLQTIRNLDQLPNLEELDVFQCHSLDSFDSPLPPSLKVLSLRNCSSFKNLKLSKNNLVDLILQNCRNLTQLPELPDTLQNLHLEGSRVKALPYIPDNVIFMYDSLHGIRGFGIHPDGRDSTWRWDVGDQIRTKQRRDLKKARFSTIHEELMMKAWHPDRVSKWLEAGESVLDMMMGVDPY